MSRGEIRMSSDALRVIVIGLDGATFDLIHPWIQEGRLPTFKRMMEEGSWGELESTMPPLTGPAWSSFITGKNPGKHGIYDFMYRDPKGYRAITINATRRNGPSFWRLLGDQGKKVIVFNVPVTYPPEEVNGIMISGFTTPPKAKDFIYPIGLKSDLEREIGFHSTFFPGATYSLGREEKFIRAVFQMTDRTIRVMDFLMERQPWDCFVGVFQGTDLLQHCLWKDRSHPLLGGAFLELYEKIDQYIGRLLSGLDERSLLLIMSDHGFGDLKKQVFLNTWLLSEGFLKLKPTWTGSMKKVLFKMGLVPMKAHQLSARLGLDLSDELMENRDSFFSLLGKIALSMDDVDWSRTKAYSMGNMGYISINLRGREPQGIVDPGKEYDRTLKTIIGRLCEMKDPEDGEDIVARVFTKEEIYSGPSLSTAPDLVVMPREFRYHFRGDPIFISNHWLEHCWLMSGFHRSRGIFLAAGQPVIKGHQLKEKKIIDVAPTILTGMGVSIPSDMDGKPMTDLFSKEYSGAFVPRYSEPSPVEKGEERTLSEEDQAEIQKRLKGLGYVG